MGCQVGKGLNHRLIFLFGCFSRLSLAPPPPCASQAASIRLSIRVTSIHPSTISDDPGLESSIWITWRSHGVEEGRGWRRFPRPRHSASDFNVKLDRASGARHHFLSHPQIHRSVTGMNADRCFPHAGTDVAVWASSTHAAWCLASLSREIQDWTQFCSVFTLPTVTYG